MHGHTMLKKMSRKTLLDSPSSFRFCQCLLEGTNFVTGVKLDIGDLK